MGPRVLLVCALVAGLALVLRAQSITPNGDPVLKARLVVLSEQLRQARRDLTLCMAQVTTLTEPQHRQQAQAALDAAALAMGCVNGADWTTDPPTCLAAHK